MAVSIMALQRSDDTLRRSISTSEKGSEESSETFTLI
jgi:hypothetical protein